MEKSDKNSLPESQRCVERSEERSPSLPESQRCVEKSEKKSCPSLPGLKNRVDSFQKEVRPVRGIDTIHRVSLAFA